MSDTQTVVAITEDMILDALANMKTTQREGTPAKCDLCTHYEYRLGDEAGDALVDGPTEPSGRWGFMCKEHFPKWSMHMTSNLNTRLIWNGKDDYSKPKPSES